MKNKLFVAFFVLAAVLFCSFKTPVEARSHFSINIGGLFAPPAPVYSGFVVEHYYPYCEPVYLQPAPRFYERPVYVVPRPVIVQPIAPRPAFSFGFGFGR